MPTILHKIDEASAAIFPGFPFSRQGGHRPPPLFTFGLVKLRISPDTAGILGLACLLLLSACSDPSSEAIKAAKVAAPHKNSHVQAEFKDTTRVDFWTEEKLTWQLKTRSLTQEVRSQRVFAKPVELIAYDRSGAVNARILADSGSMDRNLRYFRARGHVIGSNQKGMRLQADSLLFDKDADRITTGSRVTVRTEMGDILSGRGFRSDAYLNRWEILSGVTGRLRDMAPLQGLMQ